MNIVEYYHKPDIVSTQYMYYTAADHPLTLYRCDLHELTHHEDGSEIPATFNSAT